MSLTAVAQTAIGLIFVFFVFSMVASGVNEFISRLTARRAVFLERGVWRLLGGTLDGLDPPADLDDDSWYARFWRHSLVRQLGAPAKKAGREGKPSYVPSRTFATVIGDLFTQDLAKGEQALEKVPDVVKEALTSLVDDAKADAERLRQNLEFWYDSQMDRVSGWYKRHTARSLFVISIGVVLCFNLDTVLIARTLWSDPQVRAAVNAAAQAELEARQAASVATTTPPTASTTPPATTPPASTTTTTISLEAATRRATSLPLPIGWRSGSMPDTVSDWLLKALGLALSVGALVQGAPLWWDMLNRFGSLKPTGPKPASTART